MCDASAQAASIGKHKLLPKSIEFHARLGALSDDKSSTPNIVLRHASAKSASCDWESIELCAVLAPETSHDAFRTSYDNTAVLIDDVSGLDAKTTHKRIISYATTQFIRQHRVFAFSLLICGVHARFIRWDHAGAIVTKHFNYHEEPRILAEFIWRFGQLSSVQRGCDSSATLADSKERELLKAHILAHTSDPTKRKSPKMGLSCDSTYPCFKIVVIGSDNVARQLIVQRPISSPSSPAGRCTRGYIALDVASGELVFLKDYWRPRDSTRPSEAEIYSALNDASVPHLPHVRMAGDVPDDAACIQSTTTEHWKQLEGVLRFDVRAMRGYRHHRVVQDVAYPLSSVQDSKELASAVRNVIQCKHLSSASSRMLIRSCDSGMLIAYDHGWMHRDVSSGNMMLDKDGHGILNDWDHCIRVDPEKPDEKGRTVSQSCLSLLSAAS